MKEIENYIQDGKEDYKKVILKEKQSKYFLFFMLKW